MSQAIKHTQRNNRLRRFIRRNLSLFLLVLGMVFFRTAIADWNYVPSTSMEPTIYPGDVLVVNKMAYGPAIPFTRSRLFSYSQPQRGDIITFFPSHTDQCLVKRVIGVPGDTLEFRDQAFWINGKPVLVETADKHYREQLPGHSHLLSTDTSLGKEPLHGTLVIPQGKLFVMGDNRNNSFDSRYWGLVDQSQVVGKVAAVGLNLSDKFLQRFAYTEL